MHEKEKDCCIGRCRIKFKVEFNCAESKDPKSGKPGEDCRCPYTGFMTRKLTSRCKDVRCESKECDDDAYPDGADSECADQMIRWFVTHEGEGWIVRCAKLPCCTHPCNDRIKVEKFSINGTVVCDGTYDMLQEVMHDLRAEYGIAGTQPPTFQKCCVEPKVGNQ
jgi:hypothetical protein